MVTVNSFSRNTIRKIDLRLAKDEGALPKLAPPNVHREVLRHRLSAVTGAQDPDFIERLIDQGFSPENLEAIRYAPLAEVAWASGKVTPFEQVFAVNAALSSDMLNYPTAFDLFESWLTRRPEKGLLAVWEEYTADRLSRSDRTKEQEFGQHLLEIATRVALASGGLLDQGDICVTEQRVLHQIARVYGLTP